MNSLICRRTFSQAAMVSAMGLLGLRSAWAQTQNLQEGKDFRRLTTPAPVEAPTGKIEVVEFFAYSCIHCYNFEPLLKTWIGNLPANVSFRRVPVGFNAAFEPMQRLYYTLEALGQLEALHDKAFKTIHEERQRLNTPEAITAWAVKQGLDKTKFTQAYNSFGVAGKVRRATQLQDAYQVEGTPAMGIAGRFYIPGQAAKTLTVASALIAEMGRK